MRPIENLDFWKNISQRIQLCISFLYFDYTRLISTLVNITNNFPLGIKTFCKKKKKKKKINRKNLKKKERAQGILLSVAVIFVCLCIHVFIHIYTYMQRRQKHGKQNVDSQVGGLFGLIGQSARAWRTDTKIIRNDSLAFFEVWGIYFLW